MAAEQGNIGQRKLKTGKTKMKDKNTEKKRRNYSDHKDTNNKS